MGSDMYQAFRSNIPLVKNIRNIHTVLLQKAISLLTTTLGHLLHGRLDLTQLLQNVGILDVRLLHGTHHAVKDSGDRFRHL